MGKLAVMNLMTGVILTAGVAMAQTAPDFMNEPDLGFFSGLYEAVGRDAGNEFHGEPMRLDLSGRGLDVHACALGNGWLDYARADEAFALAGQLEGAPIWCQFLVDPGNYPVLTCASPEGLRLTLWPEENFDAPLVCP